MVCLSIIDFWIYTGIIYDTLLLFYALHGIVAIIILFNTSERTRLQMGE